LHKQRARIGNEYIEISSICGMRFCKTFGGRS